MRLVEWANIRTYLKRLQELEAQGLIKRSTGYLTGQFSKNIKLNWPFKKSEEAVLYNGRSIETFEDSIKTCFKPDLFRNLLSSVGVERHTKRALVERICREGKI